MEEEQKIYAAPQCEVIEMELQGMIAASDRDYGEKHLGKVNKLEEGL